MCVYEEHKEQEAAPNVGELPVEFAEFRPREEVKREVLRGEVGRNEERSGGKYKRMRSAVRG